MLSGHTLLVRNVPRRRRVILLTCFVLTWINTTSTFSGEVSSYPKEADAPEADAPKGHQGWGSAAEGASSTGSGHMPGPGRPYGAKHVDSRAYIRLGPQSDQQRRARSYSLSGHAAGARYLLFPALYLGSHCRVRQGHADWPRCLHLAGSRRPLGLWSQVSRSLAKAISSLPHDVHHFYHSRESAIVVRFISSL